LINTSRGPVIDEPALARALLQEGIAGAALDVFAVEPLAPDHIFHRTPNLLLSPHQSSWAHETGARVSGAAADAIIDLSEGNRPQWVVDPEVFDSKKLRARVK
jgi:D-3-phosphoglycerate dehydrogenase / 2-oxoglutarate reductase